MEVTSFKDLLDSLSETRKKFYASAMSETGIIEKVVNLFFDLLSLIKAVAQESDDERFTLEILVTAFRRVIASIILQESGLSQEAHMLLRNALEFMLIGIDITYNPQSLRKWKETVDINTHQNKHRVAYQTARTDILGLVEKGLLTQMINGKKYEYIPNTIAIKGLFSKIRQRVNTNI